MHTYKFNNLFLGTASKKYLKFALKEIKKVDPDFRKIDSFPDGVFSFGIKRDKEDFIKALLDIKPVYLRHVQPIDLLIPLVDVQRTPEAVVENISPFFEEIKPGEKISVQARRIPGNYDYTLFGIKQAVDRYISDNNIGIPTVKNPDKTISVFVTDSTKIDYTKSITYNLQKDFAPPSFWGGFILAGISSPCENLCEWSGGIVRFAKDDDQISRAEFKLLEAFELFNIEAKIGGKALDLGAAPGGWSKVLMEKGYYVTAVDRAVLDSTISRYKRIRFVQKDARHFRGEKDTFDIVTCDINGEPVQAAKAVIGTASSLKKGAILVMTVKLSGKNFEKTIEKSLKILKNYFSIERIRQLYHNRDEVTIFAKHNTM